MSATRYREAGRLFLAALAVPESDRPAYLGKACAGDPELRAEVESLLAHHRSETLILAPASGASAGRTVEEQLLGGRVERILRAARSGWHLAASAAAAALVVSGLWWHAAGQAMEQMRDRARAELSGDRDRRTAALEHWIAARKTFTEQIAADVRIRRPAEELAVLARESRSPADELPAARPYTELVRAVRPFLRRKGVVSVFLVSGEGVQLALIRRDPASPDGEPLPDRNAGRPLTAAAAMPLRKTLLGESILVMPFRRGEYAEEPDGPPMLLATAVPLRNSDGRIIGALGLRLATDEFNGLLRSAGADDARDAYAFDRSGIVLSELADAERLRTLGLIPDHPEAGAALNLQLRDPGRPLLGPVPSSESAVWPPTRPAADAASGRSGVSVDSYRNYAGVPVIGARKWLPEHEFGVVVETPAAAAFSAKEPWNAAFACLLGLVVGLPALVLARRVAAAFAGGPRPARIGQYLVTERIGEGGVGVVYRGRHIDLDRPVAVKLLRRDSVSRYHVKAFDREVRTAAGLSHPNCVTVFDFGRIEGRAYCVMEFVDGLTLSELAASEGPLPFGRVVRVLSQAAAALEEAHGLGLVHRDIKPHNIMVCRRGLRSDLVKVLDFGLAKPIRSSEDLRLTAAAGVAGTPVYIAPERFRDPLSSDPRSDLYSLGAVAYLLLTGRPVFEGQSVTEVIFHTIGTEPRRPGETADRPVPPALEAVVMQCLAKNPDERPATARHVIDLLASVEASDWSDADARRWWDARRPPRSDVTA